MRYEFTGKVLIEAESREAAETLYANGCDAEYCDDDNCRKYHYHSINCRCQDCEDDNGEY